MKKIVSLTLMLVFALFALVSCGGDELTPIPNHYPTDTNTDETVETVNLYIIGGEGTANNETVQPIKNLIANKTSAKFSTKLNVIYLSEAEYCEKVMEDITEKYAKSSEAADPNKKVEGAIVLVNSIDFMNELMASEEIGVVDLSSYLLNKYATLNAAVPKPLLQAARTEDGKIFALPNARTIGHYTYLVINEEIACQTLKFSPSELASYKTYEDTAELRQAMIDNNYDPATYVTEKTGSFADKAKIEAEGNVCNIISVPTVSAADAFTSAFAIIDSGNEEINERSMRIISALNENVEIRNILQYGVEYTNYTVENGNIVRKDGSDLYDMNYIYTGNAFILEFCEEIGWTKADEENGKNQNKNAIYKA